MGIIRRFGISGIQILISLLIKTESDPFRGMVVLSCCKINQGSGVSVSSRQGNRDGFDAEIIWGLWFLRLSLSMEIDFHYNFRRFGNNRGNLG